ncbi:Whi5p [Saccharomyces cerevisiae YJM1573]|nr:Whi5p [Saccharomyces cerevisiae YJM1402]AJU13544.1 Whi5p [Saccharomyces cerevisiae YJM1573]CAI4963645.1 CGH_1_HP_G0046870.mRNA.1.CDS.1 [Saccharomyces cerevisiae]CAI6706189.1 CGH_1_HP_G0046870.mRNA.1.CDS.1 [Saccharomyces cerevisiae]
MSLRTPKRSRTSDEQEQEQEQEQVKNPDTHVNNEHQQRPGPTTLLSTPVRLKNGFGTPSPPSPPGITKSITKSRRRPSTTSLQGIFMSPVNKRRVGITAHGRVYDHNDDGHESESEDDENEEENENQKKYDGHVSMPLLPPTTPKSRRSEVFLSPSPRLRSPPTAARRSTGERPIREISHTLRTRLNYALVKLQNGWTDKTLPELETELAPAVQTPPRRYHNRFPDSADAGTSAHTAFLQALGGHPPREEATAVETLMLLSSPTKKQQHRPVPATSAGEPTDETEPESDTEVETS